MRTLRQILTGKTGLYVPPTGLMRYIISESGEVSYGQTGNYTVIGNAADFRVAVEGVTAHASIMSKGPRQASGTVVVTCGTHVRTYGFKGHRGTQTQVFANAAQANAIAEAHVK